MPEAYQIQRLSWARPVVRSRRSKSDVRVDKLLLATPGAGVACGWFRFALNTVTAFDVFHGLQVTNYGLFYIPFESAPKGSNLIDVWVFCTHAQTAFSNYFVATF